MRAGAGGVEGYGGVQREGEVGLNLEGCCVGTTQPDLLLHREDGVEIVVRQVALAADVAHGLDEHVAAAAVVDALHVQAVAHLYQVTDAGDRIADGDVLFDLLLGKAQVDHVVREGRHLGSLLRGHHVDGLHTHAAGQILAAVHGHALGGQCFGVEPA